MAKKPTPTDLIPDVIVEILKNDTHVGSPHQVHGFRAGAVINLTRDWFGGDHAAARAAADVLIASKCASEGNSIGLVKAIKRGQEEMDRARAAGMKKASESAYIEFDSFPPELRALVRDHLERGNDITNDVADMLRQGEDANEIVRAYQIN